MIRTQLEIPLDEFLTRKLNDPSHSEYAKDRQQEEGRLQNVPSREIGRQRCETQE
ncbi:MAG: hypothetical protein H0W49_14400 [Nitrospirales bacterium]|nr:hypothetical protein [Nitrospirales bacterium]